MAGSDIGYYTLPVIVSFKGIDAQVEDKLGKSIQDLGKKTGEQLGTAVIAGLDPTKSTKVDSAIKGSAGAGKKMGDAITTEVAKNIDGKKVSDAITKGAQPKAAGEKIGKEVKEGIDKGMTDAGAGPTKIIKDAVKDFGKELATDIQSGNLKEAFSRVGDVVDNTTTGIKNLGSAVGVNLDNVGKFGRDTATTLDNVGGTVQGVVDRIKTTKTDFDNVTTAVKAIGSGDVATRLQGVSTLLDTVNTSASHLGVDLSGVITPMQNFVGTAKNFTDTVSGLKSSYSDLKTLFAGAGAAGGTGLAGAAGMAAPLLALGVGTYALAPGYKSNIDSIRAQAQGQQPFSPGPWAQQALSGLPGGQAIPSMVDLLPKEYDLVQRNLKVGGFQLPKRPEWLGGEPDKTKYTRRSGEEGHYWYAPGEAAKAAAAPAAATTGAANVQAQLANISIGSASISGVSIPSAASVPVGGSSSSPQSTAGRTYKYDTGGAVEITAHEGEHVFTRGDVAAMGGQQAVYDFRRHINGPNRAAIKGVGYGGAYDVGGEVKEVAAAIAPEVAKAAAQGAAQGAAAGGMAKPFALGGSPLQQSGAGGGQDTLQFLSGMLGVAGQGAEETLGLGTVFPDPMANPSVKSLFALASAFKGPIEGAMRGKLGIQQPGWRPGMPVAAMANDQGNAGSIGLPFGLPSIDIPAAPAPGPPEAPGGSAAPGGPAGNTYNVDASINYHDGAVLGVDPAAQRAADTRTQERNLAGTVAPTDPGNH